MSQPAERLMPRSNSDLAAARAGKTAPAPLSLLLTALALALCAAFTIFTLQIRTDDSYIFLVYARNLALGNGYVFNPGEHVNGSTSAIFPLLTAVASWPLAYCTTEPYLLAARLVTFLALSTICLSAMSFLRRQNMLAAAIIFPALLICTPTLQAGVGMESILLLAFAQLAVIFYCQERLRPSALFLALAVLTRPDALLLAALLLIDSTFIKRRRPDLVALVIFSAFLAAWLIFSWFYFGAVLPETFAAKSAQTQSGRWGQGWIYLKGFLEFKSLASASLAAGIATVLLLFQKEARELRAIWIISVWALVNFLVYSFVLNPPAYSWYYTIYALPVALLLAALIGVLLERSSGTINSILISCAILTLTSLAAFKLWDAGQQPVTAKYEIYKLAADWLNQNVPAGASLASNEIGVLGYYYAKGRIIDPLGLITPGAAPFIKARRYQWYIEKYTPDFLLFRNPPRPMLEDFNKSAWFNQQYEMLTILSSTRSSVRIYKRKSS